MTSGPLPPAPQPNRLGVDVLVVEDQPAVADALAILFRVSGLSCRTTADVGEALAEIAAGRVAVLVQDMNFTPGATSGAEGIELFRRARAIDPELPVLLVTAWTSLETAVQLVKDGASDYLAKPWDDVRLVASVRQLLAMRRLTAENRRLLAERAQPRRELAERADLCGFVYESEAMHRVVALAVQVAASDVPILITGPNGCGKERVAQIVQANSRRRDAPFVHVNAAALPDELLESELFGAEAGAFTGARERRIGRFETAHGGTLFLDEIGELSLAGQRKLLRVLQRGEFERLGSSRTIRVDVRLLCATNTDLRAAIAAGRFREDLYFRLNVVELAVPGLADRPEDVLPLAASFLADGSTPTPFGPWRLTQDAQRALLAHAWPGNVRELRNRVHRATLVARSAEIGTTDLDLATGSASEPSRSVAPATAERDVETAGERDAIERALLEEAGSVSRAAERLGLSRQALYRRMDKLGITLERRPRR